MEGTTYARFQYIIATTQTHKSSQKSQIKYIQENNQKRGEKGDFWEVKLKYDRLVLHHDLSKS